MDYPVALTLRCDEVYFEWGAQIVELKRPLKNGAMAWLLFLCFGVNSAMADAPLQSGLWLRVDPDGQSTHWMDVRRIDISSEYSEENSRWWVTMRSSADPESSIRSDGYISADGKTLVLQSEQRTGTGRFLFYKILSPELFRYESLSMINSDENETRFQRQDDKERATRYELLRSASN